MRNLQLGLIFVAVLLLCLLSSVFVVGEREYAIKFRLGKIEKSDYAPGLHFKVPFYNRVVKFDKRLHTANLEAENFLTIEPKNMIVDAFVKWRIDDAKVFFTDSSSIGQAERRLLPIVNTVMKEAIAKLTIKQAISDERVNIMEKVQTEVNTKAKELGIEVVDVRIMRLDFPQEVRARVFDRMITGREKEARQFRSTGQEQAKGIRAGADRTRQELLAQAFKESELERGLGDAKATEIYAQAYNEDPEFYRFTRSLRAYENSFSGKDDILVMDPSSDFFKYFKSLEK